jgi:hypothetical protein
MVDSHPAQIEDASEFLWARAGDGRGVFPYRSVSQYLAPMVRSRICPGITELSVSEERQCIAGLACEGAGNSVQTCHFQPVARSTRCEYPRRPRCAPASVERGYNPSQSLFPLSSLSQASSRAWKRRSLEP